MTFRSRALLNVAHEAPCMLLLGVPGCGADKSVPCHSDLLRHDRGAGHKSHDCLVVPGCPACHAQFTRAHLGRDGYEAAWLGAFERYQVWLWESGRIRLTKVRELAA